MSGLKGAGFGGESLHVKKVRGDFVYNDLLIDLNNAKLPAANAATYEDLTLDGFTQKVLAFDVGDKVNFTAQTHHGVKLLSEIEAHIHWTLAADEDGDEIRFQLTGVGAGINGSFSSIGTLDSGDVVLSGNTGKHNYMSLGSIANTFNNTVSSVFMFTLERVAVNDGTDASGRVYIFYSDFHVKLDSIGSFERATKGF